MSKSNAMIVQSFVLPSNPQNRVTDLKRAVTESHVSRAGSGELDESRTHTAARCVVDAPSATSEVVGD